MRLFLKIILVFLNISVGLALIGTFLTGMLNAEVHPRLAIATMTFPAWVPLSVLLLLIDFFALRKWCIWMACCMAISLPLILTVYPLNIQRGDVPIEYKDKSWKLLSYNISQFNDNTNEYPDSINPSVNYILEKDADVVVLAEGRWFYALKSNRITPAQIDSIHARYPYTFVGDDITLMSKFPAMPLPLDEFPNQRFGNSFNHSKVGGFIVYIHGVKTAVFGLHLKSLGLTRDDKNLYEDLTKGQGLTSAHEIGEVKNDLIAKIAAANVERASQIHPLIKEIVKTGCENVIVCGDFNDTPGCYALNQLNEAGFREVYPLVGNLYMHTYNMDRLLFQIDHVLFQGIFRPWRLERGDLKCSDHYPLLVTFV